MKSRRLEKSNTLCCGIIVHGCEIGLNHFIIWQHLHQIAVSGELMGIYFSIRQFLSSSTRWRNRVKFKKSKS